jgi:hypothetical protein
MSTKYSALYIVLEKPMGEEEVALLRRAIAQLRGVLSVDTSETNILAEHVGAQRERFELQQAVWDVLTKRDHAA